MEAGVTSRRFPTKSSVGAHVYLPQRLPCFKYYNVLKQENRFTLGLDTAKITDYIE